MMTALVVGFGAGERIDAVVFRMPAMAFDPVPFDSVWSGGLDQLLPQLRILDGFLIGRAPAVLPPLVDPAGDSVANIGAVGMELDSARPLERFEPANRGDQLHSVV